jgi:hypothetical protein
MTNIKTQCDLQAKKPSSSSRRVGAGSGAPGASLCVGSWTYPPWPNGFNDCRRERKGVSAELLLVRTGKSGSLRDQPSELTESRNELFAIVSLEDWYLVTCWG